MTKRPMHFYERGKLVAIIDDVSRYTLKEMKNLFKIAEMQGREVRFG